MGVRDMYSCVPLRHVSLRHTTSQTFIRCTCNGTRILDVTQTRRRRKKFTTATAVLVFRELVLGLEVRIYELFAWRSGHFTPPVTTGQTKAHMVAKIKIRRPAVRILANREFPENADTAHESQRRVAIRDTSIRWISNTRKKQTIHPVPLWKFLEAQHRHSFLEGGGGGV
jgi:hypothetical protein